MSQQQHEVCVAVRLRDDPQGRQAVLLRVSLQRAARPAGASLGLVRGAPAPPGPQPPLGDVVRAPPPTPQPSLSSHLGPASPPLGILGGRKRRPLALDPATSPVPGRAPSLTHPGAQPGSPWGRATPALSGRPGALCRVGGARQGRGWPSPSSGSDRLCGLGASTPAIWATSVGGHLSHVGGPGREVWWDHSLHLPETIKSLLGCAPCCFFSVSSRRIQTVPSGQLPQTAVGVPARAGGVDKTASYSQLSWGQDQH